MSATPETLTLLTRAAELRAAGNPWTETATQLDADLGELRKLTSTHTRDYERLSRRARTELLRESLDAALAALRQQLKSSDERITFMAASTIIRYELARMRHGAKKAAAVLERRSSRRRELPGFDPEMVRARNVQKTTEVPKPQEVIAAKNVAQTPLSAPPPPPPANTTPVPTPAPRPVVAARGESGPSAREEAMRRRRRQLLTAALRGQDLPLAAGESHNDGLLTRWLGGVTSATRD